MPDTKPVCIRLFGEVLDGIDLHHGSKPSTSGENEHLLSKFIRGCWDEEIIMKLKFEERKKNSEVPEYEILYEEIKKEELRKEQKKKRMDQTLKGKKTHQHISTVASTVDDNVFTVQHQFKSHMDRKYEDINKRITALEDGQKAMFEQLKGISHQFQNLQETTEQPKSLQPSSTQYRTPHPHPAFENPPMFCYKCGMDNHHMQRCRNSPNPTLVAEKLSRKFGNGADTQQGQHQWQQQQQQQQQQWHQQQEQQ